MAAVFAAAAHAPMTALLIVFEMSGSYSLILPLMLATGLSTVMARALQSESIYTLSLVRQGIQIWRGQEMDVLQSVRVDEVMTSDPVTVHLTTRLDALVRLIERTRHRTYPVLDEEEQLAGMVSRQDLAQAQARWQDWKQHTIAEIFTSEVIVGYPDEPVSVALQRLGVHNISLLPVVNRVPRGDPTELVGVIHRSDVGRAYQQALQHRGDVRAREQQQRLAVQTAAEVVELVVPRGSPVGGKPIKAVAWPAGCLIVAVHRGREVLVGHGDLVLCSGDRLTVYAREGGIADVRALLFGEEGDGEA